MLWLSSLVTLLSLSTFASAVPTSSDAAQAPAWNFEVVGTSGVLALEAIVVSPTLAIFFDRASNDPLMIDDHPAWGALWSFETNTASPLNLITDTFCASGALISNGTMVSTGGNAAEFTNIDPDEDGRAGIRLFEPCKDPAGIGCTIFEDPTNLHMAETRWYASSLRIFDGSLLIVGGIHERTPFYNTDPVNNFEFFPPKDDGIPRNSTFLANSGPANLFPRVFALPDGKVFMIAGNHTIIYDVEAKTERVLPDIPNNVIVTNPFDGTATLLPLSPPDFIPEILVCGGSNSSDQTPAIDLSSQDPASDQCSRMVVTEEGIERGWVVEHMLGGRIMPEMILMPNGNVLITNGGRTGYAAMSGVFNPINSSNADHPALTPEIYTPNAPLGRRFSDEGLPTTDIPRMYHSSATLTPMGNIMLAGSNPNPEVVNTTIFHTEFRVELLNPPFIAVPRPSLTNVPSKIGFNQIVRVDVDVPEGLSASNVQVALVDLGFSSHAFHASQRVVFMDSELSPDRRSLTFVTPPNNRVYPPGPAWIFLTIDDVTSSSVNVMVGTGQSPPVADQGIPLFFP